VAVNPQFGNRRLRHSPIVEDPENVTRQDAPNKYALVNKTFPLSKDVTSYGRMTDWHLSRG
jgi:hypothetical protein